MKNAGVNPASQLILRCNLCFSFLLLTDLVRDYLEDQVFGR